MQELNLALERRNSNQLYILLIVFLSLMILLLAWLNVRKPKPAGGEVSASVTVQPYASDNEPSYKILQPSFVKWQ